MNDETQRLWRTEEVRRARANYSVGSRASIVANYLAAEIADLRDRVEGLANVTEPSKEPAPPAEDGEVVAMMDCRGDVYGQRRSRWDTTTKSGDPTDPDVWDREWSSDAPHTSLVRKSALDRMREGRDEENHRWWKAKDDAEWREKDIREKYDRLKDAYDESLRVREKYEAALVARKSEPQPTGKGVRVEWQTLGTPRIVIDPETVEEVAAVAKRLSLWEENEAEVVHDLLRLLGIEIVGGGE